MSIVTLKEGDKAPLFSGKDQNGKTVSLSDLKGKRVILFFYPKDMTPGCTAEACNLGENYSDLQKRGFEVIGVSADDQSRDANTATLLGALLTLTPGTLALEYDENRGLLYIHALDTRQREEVTGMLTELERRLLAWLDAGKTQGVQP